MTTSVNSWKPATSLLFTNVLPDVSTNWKAYQHYQHYYAVPLWPLAAQKDLITQIAELPDDWDGYGAIAVASAAISNSRTMLGFLASSGNQPNFISPSSGGTIEFDWETTFGSACMEIGNSTYSFYTDPFTGHSAMCGGQIEELDAETILLALSRITASAIPHSVAGWYSC